VGKIVEGDETFIGRKHGSRKAKSGWGHKNAVLPLIEGGGKVRSFHVDSVRWQDVASIVNQNLASETKLVTDEASHYRETGRNFARHDKVNHGMDEYERY